MEITVDSLTLQVIPVILNPGHLELSVISKLEAVSRGLALVCHYNFILDISKRRYLENPANQVCVPRRQVSLS